jgi:hypothetical protein
MKRLSLFLAAAVLGLPIATVQGGTLLMENFDELTPGLTQTSVGAFSTIGGTNIDILGGATFGGLCVAPESANCIDMDGSGGNSEGILQSNTSFTLLPGVDYYLSFDLIGDQRGSTASTTVTFGSYSQMFTLASGDVTSGIVVNQLVTVSTTTPGVFLTFTSNTPGNVGDLLDNVLLTSSSPTGVPEPSSMMLLGSGLLLGSAALARRRRQAR